LRFISLSDIITKWKKHTGKSLFRKRRNSISSIGKCPHLRRSWIPCKFFVKSTIPLKMRIEQDFKEFIELLNRNKVSYLIIGGYAFSFHAEPHHLGHRYRIP